MKLIMHNSEYTIANNGTTTTLAITEYIGKLPKPIVIGNIPSWAHKLTLTAPPIILPILFLPKILLIGRYNNMIPTTAP